MLTYTHVMKALNPTTCVPLCPSDPQTSQCPRRLLGSNIHNRQGRRPRTGSWKGSYLPELSCTDKSRYCSSFNPLNTYLVLPGGTLAAIHSQPVVAAASDGSLWNNYSLVIPVTHHRCTHLKKPNPTLLPSALQRCRWCLLQGHPYLDTLSEASLYQQRSLVPQKWQWVSQQLPATAFMLGGGF